jgi:hypothetical protein
MHRFPARAPFEPPIQGGEFDGIASGRVAKPAIAGTT